MAPCLADQLSLMGGEIASLSLDARMKLGGRECHLIDMT